MSDTRRFTIVTLVLVGNACAASVPHDPPIADDATARPCIAVDSTTPPPALSGQLAGNFRLTMIAASGARKGRLAIGSLTLDGHAGHAAIALDSVGAVAAGDIGSRDPSRPGVLLIGAPNDSSDAKPMLRFGANANRTDIRAFDSAYLILIVDVATASGFSGHWRSGVATAQSSGYYCADRVAATKY